MSVAARFTIDEYEHMITCGAFAGLNQKHLELICGELRMMSPQGAEHAELVTQLNDWSHSVIERQLVRIRIQSSVEIAQFDTQPEPDVVWTIAKSYARRRPQPHEIVLLIEVADGSLAFDLGEKCQLYAKAGISDYWVVDIPNRVVHVFRGPEATGYRAHRVLAAGDEAVPLRGGKGALDVAHLFRCLDE
jgi:Uma2 family endonuclease